MMSECRGDDVFGTKVEFARNGCHRLPLSTLLEGHLRLRGLVLSG